MTVITVLVSGGIVIGKILTFVVVTAVVGAGVYGATANRVGVVTGATTVLVTVGVIVAAAVVVVAGFGGALFPAPASWVVAACVIVVPDWVSVVVAPQLKVFDWLDEL